MRRVADKVSEPEQCVNTTPALTKPVLLAKGSVMADEQPTGDSASRQASIPIDTGSIESYRLFLKAKSLPSYRFRGHTVEIPDEYLSLLKTGIAPVRRTGADYVPSPFLFDYQRDIARLAIRKKKFATFIRPGMGKSLIEAEFVRYVADYLPKDKCVLMFAPLMVVKQMIREMARFYGDTLPLEQIPAARLQQWLDDGPGRIGITNYESLREGLTPGRLGAIAADESSILKSMQGTYGQRLVELGRGIDWKLCLTGTPAPNSRIEYATHAVFLDQFPTVNAFLAKYFVNRGQTDNRWEMKPHALRPFYRSISHWCIFLQNPATYGWKDRTDPLPPIHVHIHDVEMTTEQKAAVTGISGDMFGSPGGITSRSKLAQLAKGRVNGVAIPTNKPAFVRDLIESWQDYESTLVWCRFNHEQDTLEKMIQRSGSLQGSTNDEDREQIVYDFQRGVLRTLLSKSDLIGQGLNLQIATRQIFNGLWDSAEDWLQCLARSNRIGSTLPLNVHIPITPVERAMVDNTFDKVQRIDQDTAEQESLFKEVQCNEF